MLICAPGKRNPQDNIGNVGTVIRYNISRNDRSRIFHLSGGDHTTAEHNAIYIGPGLDVPIVLTSDWQGQANDAVFRGNAFYVEGVARYGHGLKHEDGSYALEPGWGDAKGIVFEGNQYIGRHVDRPEDAKGVERGSPAPQLDWNAPRFDPSKPDEFDAFLKKHREWMMRLFNRQFGEVKLGPRPK